MDTYTSLQHHFITASNSEHESRFNMALIIDRTGAHIQMGRLCHIGEHGTQDALDERDVEKGRSERDAPDEIASADVSRNI